MALVSKVIQNAAASDGLHYLNPPVPHANSIPGGLAIGSKIYIQGMVAAEFRKLTINLQRGTSEEADIYLHLDARAEHAMVVRNTRQAGNWGGEEEDGGMPFSASSPFLVVISAFSDIYEIEVDGKPFATFAHRDDLPLTGVTHLTISGDILITSIHIPVETMPRDMRIGIPGRVGVGDFISIAGTPNSDADGIIVNLQCGPGTGDDVVFHFNPRFGDGQVVRNYRLDDQWDTNEDREGGFPFAPDQKFNLDIGVTKDGFQTWVDGVEFVKYPHHIDMQNACMLLLSGDVQMNNVRINTIARKLPPQSGNDSERDYQTSQLQVFHPPMPLVQFIEGGLGAGRIVSLSGVVGTEPERFAINLQSDATGDTDIMYHFNPRFSGASSDMIFNSREDGNWGSEVRSSETNLLLPGVAFDMQILCKEDGSIFTAINGCPMPDFAARIDLSRADHVTCDGDVVIRRVVVS